MDSPIGSGTLTGACRTPCWSSGPHPTLPTKTDQCWPDTDVNDDTALALAIPGCKTTLPATNDYCSCDATTGWSENTVPTPGHQGFCQPNALLPGK
jgi:hypothetical protein